MPRRLPPHLMTPFQQANVGKTVTGHSGIIPYHKPPIGAPLRPAIQAHQTNPAVVLNRGLMPK